MRAFTKAGGRLFKITLLFILIALIAISIMAYFTKTAMQDVKEIALTDGADLREVQLFYTQLIDNLKIGKVIASVAGVIMAVAARYGLRETAKNWKSGTSKPPEDSVSSQEGKGN